MTWKQCERRIVYKSPYMLAWEDTVELPNGDVIDDFSGVTLPNGVLVVATDSEGNLLMFNEYKYAVNDTVLTFPAGGIDGEETPELAALRELKEETGYAATGARLLGSLYPYPSKITHTDHIVRVENAVRETAIDHSSTEENSIGELQIIPVSDIPRLMKEGKINTTYILSALALAFPEYLSQS